MNDNEAKEISKGLDDIKRLLILIASKSGASQPEIGRVLGIGDRGVRHLINPKSKR